MSTRDAKRVPFTLATEQESFRLLELPASLLELICSSDPPTLSLKSQDPNSAAAVTPSKPAHAVLCTPSQTFQLRQVHTSNSVFLTRPAPFRYNEDDVLSAATCAVATCGSTLELHPVKESPLELLSRGLIEYREVEDLAVPNSRAVSKSWLFANLPYSDGECQSTWSTLCAFEHAGKSWKPTPAATLNAWQAIALASIAEGISLSKGFQLTDMRKALEEEETPLTFFDAIFAYVADAASSGGEYKLSKQTVLPWIGKIALQAKTLNANSIGVAEFVATWKDALPEAWRDTIELNLIKGEYFQPTPDTIKSSTITKSVPEASTSAAKPGARKWHEKFRPTKK